MSSAGWKHSIVAEYNARIQQCAHCGGDGNKHTCFQTLRILADYLLAAAKFWTMILRIVLAVFGLIELLFPRQVIDYMMDITTTEEATFEFKPWVYKLARLEGFAFVLIAFWWSKNRTEGN
ncbi:hypothetical protein HLASA_1119 [Halanaeroarchaeum sulfurireducens]|uniref:Uncharacterized protein n=2 Tax=Halanaeroarchaeum sulfurireducens TaxID=1604004 RepID=A0A0N9MIH8_9EURY|nr:hypothetical protein HLASA_1119 [Halanaeroarchaeum sulfurireducens]